MPGFCAAGSAGKPPLPGGGAVDAEREVGGVGRALLVADGAAAGREDDDDAVSQGVVVTLPAPTRLAEGRLG